MDYEKAFDSVETSAAMRALRKQGVNEPYAKILQDICSDYTATIVLDKEINKIPIHKGVKQGDTISILLFTACLPEVLRALELELLGIRGNREYISNLPFADDIALLSSSGDELQSMIIELDG